MNSNLFRSRSEVVRTTGFSGNRLRFASLLILVAAVASPSLGYGAIYPNSSTASWTPVLFPNGTCGDPANDQQTGSAEADIVGNQSNPSFYMAFENGGGSTSGYLGFRLRLGADTHPADFTGAAFVGVDANHDGALDAFVGVNNQGCHNLVGIWSTQGASANSPRTTTLSKFEEWGYDETSANYSFMPVSITSDPFGTDFDLNRDGCTDKFLTFFVPFSDLVNVLAEEANINITADTQLQFLAATATQDNKLNQDLNAVSDGINSTSTWTQLGALSQPVTLNGLVTVPEPSSMALLSLAGGFALLRRRSQKRRD